MLNKITHTLLLILISLTTVYAQTNSFTASWDLNSEPDIYNYQVFRGTSAGASDKIGTVQHPTDEYVDNDVEKGVLYYYRAKAVDYSLNQSDYSTEISAAIPLISGLQSQITLAENASIQLQLDNHVFDPDDSDELISWTVSGNANLSVGIENRVATITAPSSWSGQEQLTFNAQDPSGFSDRVTITVIVESDQPPVIPPVFSTIPAQQLDEDTETTVDLADYVSDMDSDISQLQFSVANLNVMSLSIDGSILTIDPNTNWNGQRTITITVTDNDNNSDEVSFNVTVNPVNDAPLLSQFPSQQIKQDTVITINLAPFVTDIDNNISELSWDFDGDNLVALSFDDASDVLSVSSVGSPAGFDKVAISVFDPAGASATDTLIVRVINSEIFPPRIIDLPDVTFDEDETFQLELNDYVTDSDDPVENLFWHSGTDENISVKINSTKNVASFIPKQNWYGETEIWFIVQDPAQNMASEKVKITVNPVNDRPNMRPLPNVNLSEEVSKKLNLANFSSDVDDDITSLNWASDAGQDVAVDISANGLATFTVSDSWQGQETVELYVSDQHGGIDTSMTIVYRQNQQLAPQINVAANLTIEEDNQAIVNLGNFMSDPDNALSELTINISNNVHTAVSYNPSTTEMTVIPDANWFGSEDLYLQVQDPGNNVAFDTMTVIVSPVNDEPILKNIGNLTLLENTTTTIELSDYIIEYDGLQDITNIEILGGNNSFFGYYLDKVNFQLTFFSPGGFFGQETYLLKIMDSQQIEASTVFSIQVIQKNIKGGVSVNYFGNETIMNMAWDTFKESKDFIEYGTTPAYGLTSDIEDDYKNDHEHILTGLAEQTQYHFRIVSESSDGNMTYSADSVFITGVSAGDKINVFPVPYRASKDRNGNGIAFTNLPFNSKINIYNLLGEPVFEADQISTTYRWNVSNSAGRKLSSGLYMYVINDEKNKKISSGKVIVVR
jgi:hypothetical protein